MIISCCIYRALETAGYDNPLKTDLLLRNQQLKDVPPFGTLAKRSQSLTVDKIEKTLRGATRFLLSLFPLLHRRFAGAKDRRKRCLAHVVSRPDAPDVLGLKRVLRRQTKGVDLAHGNLVHDPGLKQIVRHLVGNIQNLTHVTFPPISSLSPEA